MPESRILLLGLDAAASTYAVSGDGRKAGLDGPEGAAVVHSALERNFGRGALRGARLAQRRAKDAAAAGAEGALGVR